MQWDTPPRRAQAARDATYRWLVAATLLLPALAGCFKGGSDGPPPGPPPEGPRPAASAAAPPPVSTGGPAAKPVKGSAFNKLFPGDGDGYNVVYTQEKQGFAQAELSRGGKKLATLSVSDTNANPEARAKYAQSQKSVGGYPATSVGSQGTAILVGDRYQVQVRSNDPSFSAADREAWIQKFKLGELAQLGG